MKQRKTRIERSTNETRVAVELDLDGRGDATLRTGIGFFDHLLATLARHARFDLVVECHGDLHVDDHHTVEDTAIALGQAIRGALAGADSAGPRGIRRFGSAYAPLDEALARAVVDVSGRPHATVNLGLKRDRIGELSCEQIPHFARSLATASLVTLHLDVLRGENDHHRAEAAIKALALALAEAVLRTEDATVPSTKGVLEGFEA